MSSLVPFEPGREVGLADSFRLKREARQRNAELERMSGQFTIEQSRRHMDAVAREQQQQRDYRLALIGQGQTAERGARALAAVLHDGHVDLDRELAKMLAHEGEQS